jgi:hypothetical protein
VSCVSAQTGTKKCEEAEAKGVAIVNEEWIRSKVENNGGGVATPAVKMATAPKAVKGVLSGVRFNVAGNVTLRLFVCLFVCLLAWLVD